jgi:hypothetical protein
MYVYINSETNLWTVGFYDPTGKWKPESDHDTRESAANRVAYLNGATRATIPHPHSIEVKDLTKNPPTTNYSIKIP